MYTPVRPQSEPFELRLMTGVLNGDKDLQQLEGSLEKKWLKQRNTDEKVNLLNRVNKYLQKLHQHPQINGCAGFPHLWSRWAIYQCISIKTT